MSSLRHRRVPKTLPKTAFTSELGVNLVARRIMEMGNAWHPTTAAFDAGIDGFIELRDPDTAEALNLIVQVQIKGTDGSFTNETETGLEFLCDERDLAHWRRGNAPVVLVVARPRTDEAYWVSIKDYFKNPIAIKNRRVRFEKATDKFDASAAGALRKLAVPSDAGLHIGPITKPETLFTNLLHIGRLPEKLFVASTQLGKRYQVVQTLGENIRDRSEFVYRGKRILSVHDLEAPEWKGIVDAGSVEPFPTVEWAQSDDDDRLSDFTDLLGRCLSQRLKALGLRYDQSREAYYYEASPDLTEIQVPYASVKVQTSRTVFKKYKSRSGFEYYRHTAFEPRFRRYDGEWYLSITPTYHFTEDGQKRLRFYESKLKGIKALEKNSAVLGQVVFFASVLTDPLHTLFNTQPDYPHLGFDGLKRLAIEYGIDDASWLPTDEEAAAKEAAEADDLAIVAEAEQLPQLFDDELGGAE